MNILTIVKFSVAGAALITAVVFFLLDLRKKKGFSMTKALCIAAAAAALAVSGVTGYRLLRDQKTSAKQNYMSCLLMDMQDYSQARSLAEQAYSRNENPQSANLILLSLCWQGRYEICADEARSYLKNHKNDMASQIYGLCTEVRDGSEIKESQLLLFLSQVRDSLGLSQKDKEHAASLVNVQRAISLDFSIDSVKTDLLTLSTKNDVLSLKAQAQAALCQGNTAEAVELAEEAVRSDPSAANSAALALAASESRSIGENDRETQKLQEKLSDAYTRYDEIQSNLTDDLSTKKQLKIESQLAEQQERIDAIQDQLNQLPARRAINYLENASGLFRKKEPATLLALAKLYHQTGEDGKADSLLSEFLTSDSGFGALSSQRAALISAYNQAGTADDEGVSSVTDEIFASLTQGLSSTNAFYSAWADRESFADYLRDSIDRLRSGLLISRINTDAYPQIDVYVSLSKERKDGSLYTASDFTVTDLNAGVSDFTVIPPDSTGTSEEALSVCLVVDESGSMEGENLRSAQQAVTNFVRSVPSGVGVGLVSFSSEAGLRCPVTESASAVSRAVHSLRADGGTNIASGLAAAADALRTRNGSKVIVLLSDGADGSDPAYMEEVLSTLESQGIAVYSVGFAAAESSYMSSISQRTGGKFLRASEAGKLDSIYQQVSQFLVNNYIIRFTVTEQPDEYRRRLRIRMEDGVYDEKDYTVGVPEEQILAEDQLTPLSDFYRQIGGSCRPDAGDAAE